MTCTTVPVAPVGHGLIAFVYFLNGHHPAVFGQDGGAANLRRRVS